MRAARAITLAIAAVLLSGCSPPDRDIRVRLDDGQLVIRDAWHLGRLFGRKDEEWFIHEIVIYDRASVIWRAELRDDDQYQRNVSMPIVIGRVPPGFRGLGNARFERNHRYGVAIDGIGNGRVDFEIGSDGKTIANFVEREEMIVPPCDETIFSYSCDPKKTLYLSP